MIIDETSESSTWCKIVCFQRTKQLALFSVKDPKVVINGSNHSFTTDRYVHEVMAFTKHYRAADGGRPAVIRGEKIMFILFIICDSLVFGGK